jgi:hypothetical protein
MWGEPLSWHSFFGHSFRFHKSVLASPSRRRGLGKGTAFESPFPSSPLEFFLLFFVLKKLHRRTSRFGQGFGPLLEFFRGSIAQRRVQRLPIVILIDELFDVRS